MDQLNAATESERAAAAAKANALRAEEDAREDAAKRVALAKANAAPISLKQLAPGMTVAEIRAIHPQMRCDASTAKGHCHYFTEIPLGSPSEALSTLGGAKVKVWQVTLQNGRSVAVHVTLPSGEFDQVKASMVERFGKPVAQESSVVSNRMGAKFDQASYSWTKGGSTIVIKKRGAQVDEMLVSLTSATALREFAAGREAEIRKGAKDF